jgi:hypothetical protein
MPDRIKPEANQVIQYFHGDGNDTPLGARITRVIGDQEVDLEFYENGETKQASNVPLGHALDSVPGNGAYAKFLPRSDVASERHLLHPDRAATEGAPQRGEGPDSRVPPTVEHVSEEDPIARSDMGLPPEKTEDEKSKEAKAGMSKSQERRQAASKKPDEGLKRK